MLHCVGVGRLWWHSKLEKPCSHQLSRNPEEFQTPSVPGARLMALVPDATYLESSRTLDSRTLWEFGNPGCGQQSVFAKYICGYYICANCIDLFCSFGVTANKSMLQEMN